MKLSRFLASCATALGLQLATAAPMHAQFAPESHWSATGPISATSASERVRRTPLFGLSGALRAVVVPTTAELTLEMLHAVAPLEADRARWVPMLGTSPELLIGSPAVVAGMRAPSRAGIWQLLPDEGAEGAEARAALAVVTKIPFSEKNGPVLNGYHIGRYATEGSGRQDAYAPPIGFIEVTRENQEFYISEHFQLRQFLTKDQHDVWPKYLALDLRLLDKLELVLQELNAMGIRADRMHVMSGFRTPQYNGPGSGGRAQLSRHTYGDAADVWVDNDGNGYLDDLNGDGVVDLGDVRVMMQAVERVEQKYPELVGGAGMYVATPHHGPFIHVDVRGTRARW